MRCPCCGEDFIGKLVEYSMPTVRPNISYHYQVNGFEYCSNCGAVFHKKTFEAFNKKANVNQTEE